MKRQTKHDTGIFEQAASRDVAIPGQNLVNTEVTGTHTVHAGVYKDFDYSNGIYLQ